MKFFGPGPKNRRRRRRRHDDDLDSIIDPKLREEIRVQRAMEKSLADLNLNVRIVNALESAGVVTVRDLACKSKAELEQVANIGAQALSECAEALDQLGVKHNRWTGHRRKRRPPKEPKPDAPRNRDP